MREERRSIPRFRDARIRYKMVVLVLAVIAFPFILTVQLIRSSYDSMVSYHRDVEIYATVNRLKAAGRENPERLSIFLETGAFEDLNRYNEGIDRMVSALKTLEAENDDLEVDFMLHSIGHSFDSWYEDAHSAIRHRIAGGGDFYAPFYRAERIGKYIDTYLAQLLDRVLTVDTEKYSSRAERALVARNAAVIMLFLSAALSIGIGLFFSERLTGPIRRLASAAGRMRGSDLDGEALPVESADEVGTLTVAFNEMRSHIAALVRDLREKAALEERLHSEELQSSLNEKLRKEAEFLALQARINPHFLFNTLNSISRDVMLYGGQTAVELIDSISALLRYGLEQGSGIVSLGTELEIVRKYAFIQHYRYRSRIRIEIECRLPDPEAVKLPAFSIQPLVENAVIHGLEPKVEGGTVRVEAFGRGGDTVVRICDDGIGIEPRRLRAIRTSRERELGGHTSSIGLSNVGERLRMFTGDEACFRVRNRNGGGTMSEIVIRGGIR